MRVINIWLTILVIPFIVQLLLLVAQLTDSPYTLRIAAINEDSLKVLLCESLILLVLFSGIRSGFYLSQQDYYKVQKEFLLVVISSLVTALLFFYQWIFLIMAINYVISWCNGRSLTQTKIVPASLAKRFNQVYSTIITVLLSTQLFIFSISHL